MSSKSVDGHIAWLRALIAESQAAEARDGHAAFDFDKAGRVKLTLIVGELEQLAGEVEQLRSALAAIAAFECRCISDGTEDERQDAYEVCPACSPMTFAENEFDRSTL